MYSSNLRPKIRPTAGRRLLPRNLPISGRRRPSDDVQWCNALSFKRKSRASVTKHGSKKTSGGRISILTYVRVVFCAASICFFTGSKAAVNTAFVNWAI